jgi:hypothetical protein
MKILAGSTSVMLGIVLAAGCGATDAGGQPSADRGPSSGSPSSGSPSSGSPSSGSPSTTEPTGESSSASNSSNPPPPPPGGGGGDIRVGAQFQGRVDFGVVPVGGSRTRTVVLLNDSLNGASITLIQISVTGDMFALVAGTDRCTGKVVVHDATCSFDVQYRPTTTGPHVGGAHVDFSGAGIGGGNAALLGRTQVESPSTHVSTEPPIAS